MSEPHVHFAGAKRRGRPRAAEPKAQRTIYVPTAYLDRLDRLALKHGVSTSIVLCKVLQKALDMPPRE